ncbi:hypothetical protein IWX50DRAFT_679610 [Phyllosticta citricarpa]
MKFITSLLTLALASMALACSEEQDCCWSSEEACYRQHGISWVCEKQSYKDDFCYNRGVYLKDCVRLIALIQILRSTPQPPGACSRIMTGTNHGQASMERPSEINTSSRVNSCAQDRAGRSICLSRYDHVSKAEELERHVPSVQRPRLGP